MTTETTETTVKVQSMCPLDCPDSCSLEVTVEDGRVTALAGTNVNPYTEGYICSKVRNFDRHLYHESRLLRPLLRTGRKGAAEFRPVSWDEALDAIAARMRAARDELGGASILPLCYGGSNGILTQDTTDEILFGRLGASKLLRTVCAVPTGLAAQEMYGKMLGVAFEDYVHAKLIVVWGTNPHATGIHLVPHVQRAQEAGARLVVVDPRETKLAKRADLHLAVRPGADLPLALSVIRWLFREGRADEAFLAKHATGAGALRERAEPWTFARASAETGIAAPDLERFATLFADSSPAVVRCGWGLERNRNGGSAASAVMALPAVGGKFGLRGGGYTMSNGAAWDLDAAVAPETGWGRPINMNQVGRDLAERDDPPIAVLFVYNANPLVTLPNQERVRAGLEREDLFTVVFDQVMTDTARYADVVLPATTFLEHTELRRPYGSTALQMAGPVIEPVGEARPNYAVFADLARRLDLWRDGDDDEPLALARAAVGRHEAAWRALEERGIAHFSPGANGDGPPVQFVDVFPRTPDEKVHLFSEKLDREAPNGLYGYAPDPGDERHPLALISPATARTISSSLGQLHPERVALELHPDDAAARGIADGDEVRVFNDLGEVRTAARVTGELRSGVVYLPKGLWTRNTSNGNTSNALAPDTLTDVGGGACFNDARVEVERLG